MPPVPSGARGNRRFLWAEIFVDHRLPDLSVNLGEIRMNYAGAGEPSSPALLLIPAQTESWYRPAATGRLECDYQRFQWVKFLSSTRGPGLKSAPIV